jgi:hypothetical protein
VILHRLPFADPPRADPSAFRARLGPTLNDDLSLNHDHSDQCKEHTDEERTPECCQDGHTSQAQAGNSGKPTSSRRYRQPAPAKEIREGSDPLQTVRNSDNRSEYRHSQLLTPAV